MDLFETLFSIQILVFLVYFGYQFLHEHFISCPKCNATMKRVHQEHPKEPYYLDYVYRCMGCGHEIEGGYENNESTDD
jgi:uncharacterized protein with PIN domain